MGLPVEDNTFVRICLLLKITRESTYFVGSGFFPQSRLRVQRLLNVPISVVDVMGEEDCSLRSHGGNTTSLGLHPFVKRSRRKSEKYLKGLPGHSFHSENTAVKSLRSHASFRDYIKSCEKCSQQKPSTLFDVLSTFSLQ